MEAVLIITVAVTPSLAHGSCFKVPYQHPVGHYRAPRGKQEGVLTVCWGRSANSAKRWGKVFWAPGRPPPVNGMGSGKASGRR